MAPSRIENKLGITNEIDLAHVEEKISKSKACELFTNGVLDGLVAGSWQSLSTIHHYLFSEIYDFAGQIRTVNISKGQFRFAPVLYIDEAIKKAEAMPQSNFNQIIEKYIEMNIIHPFREGNGRSMRIWLDLILKKELQQVIDWSLVQKDDYLLAMER
ncbi:Fic/DOC family protein, partial [Pelotalea chapellei]